MSAPSLVAWTEPGRTHLSRAAAWHAWAPKWLPSRVATVVRRRGLRRYAEPVLCRLSGGCQFVAHPSDLLQCLVATTGGWEQGLLDAVRPFVSDGSSVLDIGAHVGYTAVVFADWVGPSGRVHCFEPIPAHRDQIARNLIVNGFEPRVNVVAAAVTDAAGEQPFFQSHLSNSGMSSLIRTSHEPSRMVTTLAIDDWIADALNGDVALAKIDVEGAEALVLRGMRRTLACGRCHAVLIELHPQILSTAREDVRALVASAKRYRMFDWAADDRFRENGDADSLYVLAVRDDLAHKLAGHSS